MFKSPYAVHLLIISSTCDMSSPLLYLIINLYISNLYLFSWSTLSLPVLYSASSEWERKEGREKRERSKIFGISLKSYIFNLCSYNPLFLSLCNTQRHRRSKNGKNRRREKRIKDFRDIQKFLHQPLSVPMIPSISLAYTQLIHNVFGGLGSKGGEGKEEKR